MKEEKTTVYCTYFDKGFLLKGLALHESLIKHNPNAKLWILAFDKYTEKILNRIKLKGVTVVALEEFEDKELLAIKPTRHPVEYYWTCTPSWILYVLNNNPQTKYVVYLDADMFIYSDVDGGVAEIGNKSILAVEHRFPKGGENMEKVSGRFNVAFNVFKNDKIGRDCLKRWRGQCLEWCYWTPKDGKLGDQSYLDEWSKLYSKNFTISKNVGVDAAPWNISQYKVKLREQSVYVDNDQLICYHFHQFQILGPNHFSRVLGYTLSTDVIKNIYEPYEKELRKQYEKVKKLDRNYKVEMTEKDKAEPFRNKVVRRLGPTYSIVRGLLKWLKD
jgi:hypothetical protein